MSDEVWNIERTYIQKVIDTVNDLDNVLYEVSNESGSPFSDAWQAEVISLVKQYEATKPRQHPVGMTFQWKGGSDLTLYRSAADWISAGSHVPPSDGTKVIINDTDHAYGPPELKLHDWREGAARLGLGKLYVGEQCGIYGSLPGCVARQKRSSGEDSRSTRRIGTGSLLCSDP